MIEVRHLKKQYERKLAVKDISFSVEKGEIFGFLGPNGVGKTTTVKILTGQLLPISGEASIMGLDVIRDRYRLHGNIGVVPENANLYDWITVRENLEFYCRLVILAGTVLVTVTCTLLGMIVGLYAQNQMATGMLGLPLQIYRKRGFESLISFP